MLGYSNPRCSSVRSTGYTCDALSAISGMGPTLRMTLMHPPDRMGGCLGAGTVVPHLPDRWYRQTMLATIDAGGRVVVPKEVRERLGLRPGSRIVLREVEGRLEISPATTPVRLVDHEGALVAVADTDLPVLTAERVRDVVDATRR